MFTGTKILLVDDEVRILEIFSLTLRDLGYYVKTASNAESALQCVSGEPFDLVFIDQMLGSSRGLDLMHTMMDVRPGLYYVIVTGNGSTDLAVEALKSGASDFIMKPFLNADLLRSIDYVNRRKALDSQKQELLATLERAVHEKTDELKDVYFSVLSSLTQAMEKKDMGTYGHSKRVNHYTRLIAAALDLGEQERQDLKAASTLHDIGKIGISDFVLGKRGPLNSEEKELIKSHPQKGYEILKPLKQFEPILPAILHHHEHYDGTGYPAGLSGERIPFYARIIAVADAYDAILSTRPYRTGADHDRAIAELLDFSGRQFDPAIVKAFVGADVKFRRAFGYGASQQQALA
jgi:cyclic di-GMP phosphodiesterase